MLAKEDRERGGGGKNWEKYFIGLFHVSEHLGHFKAIKNSWKNIIFLIIQVEKCQFQEKVATKPKKI